MKREEAIKKIDNLVNVLAVDIPENIELYGNIYHLKKDISSGDSTLIPLYQELYERVREDIVRMEDVPDDLVKKAIILRRVVLFLKQYNHTDEIEDKKRWIKFVKKME